MTTVTEAPADAAAMQPAAPCPKTPWCVKTDGHPGDKPASWSPCTSERLPYPTTCHAKIISHVYAEADAGDTMIVVEHTDEQNDTALLLYADEAEELMEQIRATLAAARKGREPA